MAAPPAATTAAISVAQSGIARPPLVGHRAAVNALAVNGTRLASASDDGTIRVWSLGDGTITTLSAARLPQSIDPVTCLTWHDNGQLLFAAHGDIIHAWTFDRARLAPVVRVPTLTIESLTNASPHSAADTDSDDINALVYRSDGALLGACYDSGMFALWKVEVTEADSGTVMARLVHRLHRTHDNICSAIAFTHAAANTRVTVLSLGFDSVCQWTRIHRKHEQVIGKLTISKDSSDSQNDLNPPFPQCVDAIANTEVAVIGLGSGELMVVSHDGTSGTVSVDYRVRCHSNAIVAVRHIGSLSVNGSVYDCVVSASSDRRVRVWSFERKSHNESVGDSDVGELACVRRWSRKQSKASPSTPSITASTIATSSDEFAAARPYLVASFRHGHKLNDIARVRFPSTPGTLSLALGSVGNDVAILELR